MCVFSFRNIRIFLLLLVLAATVVYTNDQKLVTQSWYQPIGVIIYPINADQSVNTQKYIESLGPESFAEAVSFIEKESKPFLIAATEPVKARLETELKDTPPLPPSAGSSRLSIMLWSLKLRWWAFRHSETTTPLDTKYTIRAYVLYHDPAITKTVQHSVGIQKGLITIVHAFAHPDYTQQNNIIFTHELLHTFGATDKYDPTTNLPAFPEGYGNPDQSPLYPQRKAEIMAVKKALSESRAEIPNSLRSELVGKQTAREIGWLTDR